MHQLCSAVAKAWLSHRWASYTSNGSKLGVGIDLALVLFPSIPYALAFHMRHMKSLGTDGHILCQSYTHVDCALCDSPRCWCCTLWHTASLKIQFQASERGMHGYHNIWISLPAATPKGGAIWAAPAQRRPLPERMLRVRQRKREVSQQGCHIQPRSKSCLPESISKDLILNGRRFIFSSGQYEC